jgi:hypothetical protein
MFIRDHLKFRINSIHVYWLTKMVWKANHLQKYTCTFYIQVISKWKKWFHNIRFIQTVCEENNNCTVGTLTLNTDTQSVTRWFVDILVLGLAVVGDVVISGGRHNVQVTSGGRTAVRRGYSSLWDALQLSPKKSDQTNSLMYHKTNIY